MPSSKNYVRDLKQEYKTSVARGETKKRAKRNAARAKLMKAGVVKKGDGKDVNHKNGVGAGNARSNLSVQSKSTNRSHGGKIGNRAGKAAGARIGHKSASKSSVPSAPKKKKKVIKKRKKPLKFITTKRNKPKKVRF